MLGRHRTILCLGVSLVWFAWTPTVATADPSQYCRDLAVQFGTAPAQLDANSLANLGTCVMGEIKVRAGSPSESAPSAQQPDSSGTSPVDQPGWGQWSSPPSWSNSQGKTKSWGTE